MDDRRHASLTEDQRFVIREFFASGGSLADLLKAEVQAGNLTRGQADQVRRELDQAAGMGGMR